jgi:FixH
LKSEKKRGLLLVLAALMACPLLWADGGTVVLQKRSGPFLITLFSDPTPVRVGRADLSVMCQKAEDNSPILDAKVLLHLRRPSSGNDIVEFTLPAKHDNASNKLLYAAALDLPSPGNWKVNVDVERNGILASVGGSLTVLEKQPAIVTYWPFFIIVPLVALLFAINRRLKRGRELRHPRARP